MRLNTFRSIHSQSFWMLTMLPGWMLNLTTKLHDLCWLVAERDNSRIWVLSFAFWSGSPIKRWIVSCAKIPQLIRWVGGFTSSWRRLRFSFWRIDVAEVRRGLDLEVGGIGLQFRPVSRCFANFWLEAPPVMRSDHNGHTGHTVHADSPKANRSHQCLWLRMSSGNLIQTAATP